MQTCSDYNNLISIENFEFSHEVLICYRTKKVQFGGNHAGILVELSVDRVILSFQNNNA